MVVEPVPRLRVDRLANTSDDTEGAEVSLGDVLLAETTEHAHGRRSGVEVRELVGVNGVPEAGWSRVDGRRLEYEGGNTVGEWSVYEVTIARISKSY